MPASEPANPATSGTSADEAARDRRNLAKAARIVSELRPLRDTFGEVYLREQRGIDTAAIADVLDRVDAIGWHPAVYFHEPGDPKRGIPAHPLHGRHLWCIVGIMTDPVTAQPTGAISRTYIGPDGRKIGKAKTLGSPAGIIRLSLDEDVLEGLVIVEGVETGLAAMSVGYRPLWAMGSRVAMKSFPVLDAIQALTGLADRDAKGDGEKAAQDPARRWQAAGREVRIMRLRSRLGDVNDALMNR